MTYAPNAVTVIEVNWITCPELIDVLVKIMSVPATPQVPCITALVVVAALG
jgi:hypothetical protein